MKTVVASLVIIFVACGGTKEPLFQPVPECAGDKVMAFAGQHAQLISELDIADRESGFDLDGDGELDNKLWGLQSLASPSIQQSLKIYDLLIPFEFYDYPEIKADECVKFAAFLGQIKFDRDEDTKQSARSNGDCNDLDPAINRDASEVLGNGIDDDCDGRTDYEDGMTEAPNKDDDNDGDGVTIGEGDCDDTRDTVAAGFPEICDDGLDNDCDSNADFSDNGSGEDVCSPFRSDRTVQVDPLSLDASGQPQIAFTSGIVEETATGLRLTSGPDLFKVTIPAGLGIELDLAITGTTIEADIVPDGQSFRMENARLGGVLEPRSLEAIRGLEVEAIMLPPENSLLDAIFANTLLKTALSLPKLKNSDYPGCVTPDIDVDQDGLEGFCDSNPTDDKWVVDVCIDGDGTVYLDELDGQGNIVKECTEATDADGNYLFRDGISVAMTFATKSVTLKQPPL